MVPSPPVALGGSVNPAQKIAVEAGVRHALQKLAREMSEAEKARAALAGAGATGAGLAAVRPAKERITGRMKLFHGTTPEAAQRIRAEGLRPASATGAKGITEEVLGKEIASKPLVYMHPSKLTAKTYQEQAKALAEGGWEGVQARRAEAAVDPLGTLLAKPKGVVEAQLPYTEYAKKFRANPETGGSVLGSLRKGIDPISHIDLAHRTKTIEGGVSPQHIVGGKGFQRLGKREVINYAKKHPGRFASGIGLGLGGAAALGYGGKKLFDVARAEKG